MNNKFLKITKNLRKITKIDKKYIKSRSTSLKLSIIYIPNKNLNYAECVYEIVGHM